ncbi:5-formyltetrahydrofolate cyclo-ligase [Simiduia sp. 21SJ11W-1]|uniref:5-formyltetrahydrofolate cyclo-ligase n=1 Tax=Simiduia sp. 21SJ11W-1 TaxID=2909669 RepID=UPI0020A13C13|nr:5-formyltetrahydrofolate cyclo-ligase [Simiduia sp. 21SJ11W-1]UTA48433.1 5-formyltetrahydrofolate cyclo-ligase [Simiduia sp. 21SJ11W-1]
MDSPQTRSDIRRLLRARRRALSSVEQQRAAVQLATHLAGHLWFKQAQHIAFYLPNDGEIDPTPLMQLALAQAKRCYLPVVTGRGLLQFKRYLPGQRLKRNRYGIAEPRPGAPVRPAWLIDLTLLPLVGYNHQGHRLGMGGGYYDRTFGNTGLPRAIGRRLGLAHSCQLWPALTAEHWDIPLHAIATEHQTIITRP